MVLAGAVLALPVGAQEPQPAGIETGGELFYTWCAPCHGESGRGDGPVAEQLEFAPPDLTRFARRNGGEYSSDLVRRIVDGRNPVRGHGGPEMPIWGDAFRNREYGFSEERAAERIRRVVDYLATLQQDGEPEGE